MSITYSADVFCDKCGNWEHGLTGPWGSVNSKTARIEVQKQGWRRVYINSRGYDLCPHCVKAFESGIVAFGQEATP
jgi:hypothetical protein